LFFFLPRCRNEAAQSSTRARDVEIAKSIIYRL